METPATNSFRKLLLCLMGCGWLLLACLNLVPNAATAIWQIQWYPLHLCSVFLICLGSCGLFLRSGTIRTGQWFLLSMLGLMALGYLSSAWAGPFRERTLVYSLPVFASIFCGGVFLLTLGKEDVKKLFQSKGMQFSVACFLSVFAAVSLYRYVTQDVIPLYAMAERLDQAAQGGLRDLVLQKHLPALRNGSPFGHPNYNSGFLLLMLPLLFHGIMFPAVKGLRPLSLLALVLGIVVLITTQSRNALLGLAVAAGMGTVWCGSKRKNMLPILAGTGLLTLLVLFLIPRFQISLLSVSPERLGVWKAAWLTGLTYFPLGSGEGLASEMLQLFSPRLSASWENLMQFHHTWLHVWAVGGLFAALGILGISFWVIFKLFKSASSDQQLRWMTAPSVMALSAGFVVFMSDYQLDIFPMALLLFVHLSGFAILSGKEISASTPMKAASIGFLWLPALALVMSASRIPASVQSRRAVDVAGLAFENGDPSASASEYLNAFEALPEPYFLNMAGMLFAQTPATHSEAISRFEQSLSLWESQTLVHEFLVYLRMMEAEATSDATLKNAAWEKALHHARRRAEISPQLKGVYLDLAVLLNKLERPDDEITQALYYELLMQGELIFDKTWTVLDDLQVYRPLVIEKLVAENSPVSSPISKRIATLQGYLYLMNALPPAHPAFPTVEEKMRKRLDQPGVLHLLNQVCMAGSDSYSAAQRLLVFVFSSPVTDSMVTQFLRDSGEGVSCMSSLLNFGQARLEVGGFQGVGLSARHPYAIPVTRPRSYPEVFGGRLLPAWGMKNFRPEEME